MNAAKREILARIRRALADVPAAERPGDVPVARAYRRGDARPAGDVVGRFAERVAEYRADVQRVDRGHVGRAVTAACARRRLRRLAVPADLPAEWLPPDVELRRDDLFTGRPLSYAALDSSDGVLTGCALAIAETGTIVLDGGARQGRRALTLLPDYHLCVVLAEQIVSLVPEAVARLGNAVRATQRPVTLVSGPSATSDIELDRVEGVHGPRTLDVLIVG